LYPLAVRASNAKSMRLRMACPGGVRAGVWHVVCAL